MPQTICIFKRIEKKYLLKKDRYEALMSDISDKLTEDKYGKSTVCSAYLDTPDFRIIRASIDATNYKEKLRLRSYGIPKPDSDAFLEIKKKFDGVVYKRRVVMKFKDATDYIYHGIVRDSSQIMREIDYAMNFYGKPKPMAMLCCEREAFFAEDIPDLRLTFDTNIRYRTDNPTQDAGDHGIPLIPDDTVLLEVKTGGGMPLWLANSLDAHQIYPTSFSKYGTAYRDIEKKRSDPTYKGEFTYV